MNGSREDADMLFQNWRGSVASIALLAFGACSSTATITRTNGPAYEAEIVNSDEQSLHVLTGVGYVARIPREEIVEVDHPGNVLLTIGAVTLGFAVMMLAASTAENSSEKDGMRVAGTVYGLTGLAFGLAGGIPYMSSKKAASTLENAPPRTYDPRQPYPYGFPLPYPPPGAPAPASAPAPTTPPGALAPAPTTPSAPAPASAPTTPSVPYQPPTPTPAAK